MMYARMIIEIGIITMLIYYFSGRLMGAKINFLKRVLSVFLGVTLTTFVYWLSYLRFTEYLQESIFLTLLEGPTIIWIGSMLLISMLFYLLIELFDPIELSDKGERLTGQKFIFQRIQHNYRRQKRLRQVLQIAIRNGFSRTIKYARHRENNRDFAIAFRDTLEESGGVFIKFGQMLSTRTDLFPPVFIEELDSLQQNVKPLTNEQVSNILDKSIPYAVDDVFSEFHMEPLAAGSIGQVHRAVLRKNGQHVVVKLLRPEVKTIMRDDLNILVEFTEWVTSKSTWAENIGLQELAIGFAAGLREEINFDIEARNTIQVANALLDSPYQVKVPHVYAEYSNEKIIVLEYFEGKSIIKGEEVFQHFQVDQTEFARIVLFSFFEQIFSAGIFHADPHPGNIFIDSKDGVPVLLDFGAVGRLAENQKEGLSHFIIGVQQNDVGIIYDAIVTLVENNDRIERQKLEQEIGQLLMRISYVDRIPTSELIHSLFDIIREFGLSFYPSVGMALRSLISLDGTLHSISPTFDMFTESKVFAKKYKRSILRKPFKEPRATKERIEEELVLLVPELMKIPKRIDYLVQRIESGKIILHHDIFSDKKNANFITQLFSRFVLLLTGITFGVVSAALLAIAQFIDTFYGVYLSFAAYAGLFLFVILLVRLSVQAIRDMKKHNG
ncbi:MAG TPA: AarF/UbiB family protein [Planococcus sp. (in: firmicutes)]|nr:AarF/UbiB family protein [Planococcus sp. (in: firmicutes)]